MRRGTEDGRRRSGAVKGGQGWLRALRQIFGMPDYEAYLEHCRAAGYPPRLTEAEFLQAFFDAKGEGARCC